MRVIYYNKNTGNFVEDLTCRKGPEVIKEDFGEGFDQAIVIDEKTEGYTVTEEGILQKVSIINQK